MIRPPHLRVGFCPSDETSRECREHPSCGVVRSQETNKTERPLARLALKSRSYCLCFGLPAAPQEHNRCVLVRFSGFIGTILNHLFCAPRVDSHAALLSFTWP